MNKKLKAQIFLHFGSQRAFAFKMMEEESYVSKVVRGWRTPDPERKASWAEALECEIDDIFPLESERRTYTHEG